MAWREKPPLAATDRLLPPEEKPGEGRPDELMRLPPNDDPVDGRVGGVETVVGLKDDPACDGVDDPREKEYRDGEWPPLLPPWLVTGE